MAVGWSSSYISILWVPGSIPIQLLQFFSWRWQKFKNKTKEGLKLLNEGSQFMPIC